MPDMQQLSNLKQQLISAIQINGPSLPVHLSKSIKQSPLFTSAFLAELVKDQKLKTSNLKVGSSPLYYLVGQEHLLEKFSEHLNSREQQAFHQIKTEQVIKDQDLDPPVRIAIKSIPDFAVPIQVRVGNEVTLFWKYFQLSNQETRGLIQKIVTTPEREKKKSVPDQSQVTETQQPTQSIRQEPTVLERAQDSEKSQKILTSQQPISPIQPTPILSNAPAQTQTAQQSISPSNPEQTPAFVAPITPSPIQPEPNNTNRDLQPNKQDLQLTDSPKPKIPKLPKPPVQHEFPQKIKQYLQAKDIEILETFSEKKKEYTAKVRTDELFGKQVYYLIAKEKKNITDTDLTLALQQAQTEKMPALILSPGKLNKKAQDYRATWHNLLKFEKLNI